MESTRAFPGATPMAPIAKKDVKLSTAPSAREEPLRYLKDTPPVFRDIADVLLILDNGEELPTHRCTGTWVAVSRNSRVMYANVNAISCGL